MGYEKKIEEMKYDEKIGPGAVKKIFL